MTSLAGRFLATLRRRALCRPGARVVAAVSGGADSVAMALLLAELASAGHVVLAAIAHLNHHLRGPLADRDASFTAGLADRLGVPFHVGHADVASLAARPGRSLEEAAREARYGFLEQARLSRGADVVAVAHTRDDQAETVLLQLLRGCGTRGLAAIHPRRGHVIRPAIDLRRTDLIAYLEARGQTWMDDETNRDVARRRNRVRHQVLPALVGAEGPGVVATLARAADIAAGDEALLAALSDELMARAVVERAPRLRLAPDVLADAPPALARRVVQRALAGLGGRRPGFAHVEAVLRLVARGTPGRLAVPGGAVELSAARGVLFTEDPTRILPMTSFGAWRYLLGIPGELAVPEAGLRLRAELDAPPVSGRTPPAAEARLDRSLLGDALVVRGWQRGDRVRLAGNRGRKKLQDLFVDRKVPRDLRHRVPIVAAADGRIVWVAGHLIAGGFAASSATKSVVVLNFEPLGGR